MIFLFNAAKTLDTGLNMRPGSPFCAGTELKLGQCRIAFYGFNGCHQFLYVNTIGMRLVMIIAPVI